MTKEDNIKKIKRNLNELENKPMTWDLLDQFIKVFVEAMSILDIYEFIRLAKDMDYTQDLLRKFFVIASMRDCFKEKVNVPTVMTIFSFDWKVIEALSFASKNGANSFFIRPD